MTEQEAIKELKSNNELCCDNREGECGSYKEGKCYCAEALVVSALEEYIAIGSVEECREARERQKVKKPVNVQTKGFRYTDTYKCPSCGVNFSGTGIAEYCYHCGQAFDWSEA